MENKIQLKQDGRFYWGWLIVLLNFFLMVIGYVSCVSIASIFVLPVTKALGCSNSQFTMYVMFVSLITVIISPYIGKKMRTGNMKLIMALGCISGGIGFALMSQATSLIFIYIASLFIGFSFCTLTSMPIAILCNNWFGGKVKGTAMGISYIGGSLGSITIIPFASNIMMRYGWEMAYLGLGALMVIVLLPMVLLIVRKTPEEKGFYRMGVKEGESTDYTETLKGTKFEDAKKMSIFWVALISVVLTVFASSALLANAVPYFVETGIESSRAASLFSIMLGSMIVGKPILGFFCDKVSVKAGAILSCFIFAGVFVLLYMMKGGISWLVWGAIISYGFGASSITVIPALMVNGLFGEKDYGRLVGYFNSATSLGGAFGGTVAAFVFDITGSYTSFWIVAAIALIIAGLMRWGCFSVKDKKYPSSTELD